MKSEPEIEAMQSPAFPASVGPFDLQRRELSCILFIYRLCSHLVGVQSTGTYPCTQSYAASYSYWHSCNEIDIHAHTGSKAYHRAHG